MPDRRGLRADAVYATVDSADSVEEGESVRRSRARHGHARSSNRVPRSLMECFFTITRFSRGRSASLRALTDDSRYAIAHQWHRRYARREKEGSRQAGRAQARRRSSIRYRGSLGTRIAQTLFVMGKLDEGDGGVRTEPSPWTPISPPAAHARIVVRGDKASQRGLTALKRSLDLSTRTTNRHWAPRARLRPGRSARFRDVLLARAAAPAGSEYSLRPLPCDRAAGLGNTDEVFVPAEPGVWTRASRAWRRIGSIRLSRRCILIRAGSTS
jgi:hypothetical protein